MSGFSFHATVQGRSHSASGVECQDYSGSLSLPLCGAHVFAVADGHGDPACLRSAIGSRLAVEVALSCLGDFAQLRQSDADAHLDGEGLSSRIELLCGQIVDQWRQSVTAHYEEHPPTKREWDLLSEHAKQVTEERPAHLYGTTLVAGVLLPDALVLLQQGDGCCVVLFDDASSRMPIPEDERCVGNMTTSLCDVDAEHGMRGVVLDLRASTVALCVVGSDGVDKSLYGDEGLFDFVDGIALESLSVPSQEMTESRLHESLSILTQWGCGDDASISGYADPRVVSGMADVLFGRRERYKAAAELAQLNDKLRSMKRLHDRYSQHVPADPAEARRRREFLEEYEQVALRIQAIEGEWDSVVESGRPTSPKVNATPPLAAASTWVESTQSQDPAVETRSNGMVRLVLMLLVPVVAAMLGFALCYVLTSVGVLGNGRTDDVPDEQPVLSNSAEASDEGEPEALASVLMEEEQSSDAVTTQNQPVSDEETTQDQPADVGGESDWTQSQAAPESDEFSSYDESGVDNTDEYGHPEQSGDPIEESDGDW